MLFRNACKLKWNHPVRRTRSRRRRTFRSTLSLRPMIFAGVRLPDEIRIALEQGQLAVFAGAVGS